MCIRDRLVTFEELYDLSNPDEPKKVTEHKDIDDEGQTITFKEKPEEPEKPETPQTPEKPHQPSNSPKTGDNTNLYGLLALLLTSGAGLAGILSLIHISVYPDAYRGWLPDAEGRVKEEKI